jgi:peptide/nickel transport system substrate-binding protein
MNPDEMKRLDEYRFSQAGPLENDLIDEFAEGGIDRGAFIRRATILGLSMGMIGSALAAYDAPLAFGAPSRARAGGRLRLGVLPPPAKDLEPYRLADTGGLVTDGIAGEFLTRSTKNLTIVPELAVSWKPNANATVWTFKLRPNVKFQNGQAFGAADVVASYKRLVSADSGALSAFKGVLSSGGIKAIDNLTVRFTLDSPTASFPYLTSSSTYQAIMLPRNYKVGTWDKTTQGTGAFRLVSYSPGVGAKFDRNPGWWGGRAPLDGVDITYYTDVAAHIAALVGGQVDMLNEVQFANGRVLFNNPRVQIFPVRGAQNRTVGLRVNLDNPLKDRRVRQAIALTLDRPAIVKTLFSNFADIGNDSPFAPVFPSTNKSVPQRKKDLAAARKLLAAAGYSNGFKIPFLVQKNGEMPQLAQIMQRSAKAIGIDLALQLQTDTQFFAGTQWSAPCNYGNTPWLNGAMTLTGWGGRSVPNVYLSSEIKSCSIWNEAQYKNPKLDKVIDSYLASIAISDQRRYAGQIQRTLLADTPFIFPYFFNSLAAGSKQVRGYNHDASALVYLSRTSLA